MDGTCNPVPAKRSFRRTRIFNQIAPYCLICPHRDTSIKWGQGVNIGMFSRLACINEISLGNTVLTGPNVFIRDHNHAYEDVEKPISAQGNIGNNNKVIIDDDCWIGTNVVICGNVHIGKHIVIGAGTFVNKDIPSYCVAVGNPARVVKKYNFERGEWEKV
ncbi:acyltransferase [Ruminococcus sp. AM41-10BH]|nr:acyltransferase [Ruminococcus sp. AM41-10BH]